jgi:hypothetical protein
MRTGIKGKFLKMCAEFFDKNMGTKAKSEKKTKSVKSVKSVKAIKVLKTKRKYTKKSDILKNQVSLSEAVEAKEPKEPNSAENPIIAGVNPEVAPKKDKENNPNINLAKMIEEFAGKVTKGNLKLACKKLKVNYRSFCNWHYYGYNPRPATAEKYLKKIHAANEKYVKAAA